MGHVFDCIHHLHKMHLHKMHLHANAFARLYGASTSGSFAHFEVNKFQSHVLVNE